METKKACGIAKKVVTRKINEITDLMTDDEVNKKTSKLKEAFDKFRAMHRTSHSQLTESEAFEESTSYYDSVFDQLENLQESVDVWIRGIKTMSKANNSFQVQVRPDDSMSNIGTCSLVSRYSCTSQMSCT